MPSLNPDQPAYHAMSYGFAETVTGEYFAITITHNAFLPSEWQSSVWDGAISALDTYFSSLPETNVNASSTDTVDTEHPLSGA